MLVERGREGLHECESRLRGLLAEAAAAGDYDAALQLTEWARGVAALEIGPSPSGAVQNSGLTGHHEGDGADRTSASSTTPRKKSSRRRRKKGVPQAQRKRKAIAATYPRFARLQNELVKIGWSKKAKKEYQHRAPRRVIDSLVDHLAKVVVAGEIFSTEQLFPLYDKDGDSEIPSYQAYLCLAWLREGGLVRQHGREGYTAPDVESVGEKIEAAWNGLPSLPSDGTK